MQYAAVGLSTSVNDVGGLLVRQALWKAVCTGEDKNLKGPFEQAVKNWPYSTSTAMLASAVSAVMKSAWLWYVLPVDGDLLKALQTVLITWYGVSLTSQHHSVWEGRPLALIVIDVGHDALTWLLSTLIVTTLKRVYSTQKRRLALGNLAVSRHGLHAGKLSWPISICSGMPSFSSAAEWQRQRQSATFKS